MSNSNDELLSKFIAVTGCPTEEALPILEASNWNLDTAISTYKFGHQDVLPPTTAHPILDVDVGKKKVHRVSPSPNFNQPGFQGYADPAPRDNTPFFCCLGCLCLILFGAAIDG